MSSEPLVADAKNEFPVWVLSIGLSEPQAYSEGRELHEYVTGVQTLGPAIHKPSLKSLKLARKDVANSYRKAFKPGASILYPQPFHGICYMMGHELEKCGVRLGFYNGNAALRPYDVGVDGSLVAAAGLNPYPPVKFYGRNPCHLSPILYSDDFLLDDRTSLVNISNSFDNRLVKAIGRKSVDMISSEIRECASLPNHRILRLIQGLFNVT